MSELIIREMENGEEFADWFADLTEQEEATTGDPVHLDEHYLILSNAIGDWIGGLRYNLRGGVAHLTEIAVRHEERHQGHGHRLLEAFEQHAAAAGRTWWSSGPTTPRASRSCWPMAGCGCCDAPVTRAGVPGT